MFKISSKALACVLMASAAMGTAQQRAESIQEIPYTRLQSIADSAIDFETRAGWSALPKALGHIVAENGVRFATKFEGQTVSGQRSDTVANNPLDLTQLTPFSNADISAAFNRPDGFRTLPNYVRRSPYLPLIIGGSGRIAANMLSGFLTPENGRVLTSLSPRLQLLKDGSWIDNSVIGIEPVAFLFVEDQTAVGFTLVALNRRRQEPFVAATMYESLVQVKFFRRNGSLISEVVFSLSQTDKFAFARCGETVDIAGIQITNSSLSGFAVDDIIFGVPRGGPITIPQSSLLSQPSDTPNQGNPLDVQLCSYFTS